VICRVVELRRYTLHPNARDTLIELFDREFVETQEALGMQVLGTFRDLDDPDQFVWLRGFESMAARAPALQAFYSGPVWAEHRTSAVATMIDSDNVLLLRPAEAEPQLEHDVSRRPPVGAPEREGTLWVTISAEPLAGDAFARFVTEHTKNDFPALPVREDVDVAVALWRAEPPPGAETLRLSPTSRSLLP
jgi:NIPSNAP